LLKLYLPILLSLILSISISASEADTLIIPADSSIVIDSIEIRGNDITEEYIILREMNLGEGDSVNTGLIQFNQERIYSLGLFSFVNLHMETVENSNVLVITVSEGWYIWPLPFWFIREKDLSKSTFGLNLVIQNFRGRNETIQATAGFGYDPFFLLAYSNPLIVESLNLNMSVSASYQSSSNKSPSAAWVYGGDFDYKGVGGAFSVGKRLNQFNDVFLIFGYNYVEAPSEILNETMASNTTIDRKLSVGMSYVFDTRDLAQFPGKGLLLSAEYLYKGIIDPEISYNVLGLGYRQYERILDTFIAKWRVGYRHTFGHKVPNYDYSFFGHNTYIRGHRNVIREGHNQLITSVQVDYPILKEWNISMKLPFVPQSITSTRIGLSLNLFVDSGIVYYNGDPIDFNNFDSGWGIGLKILFLPYNAFRFEYAFNEHGQGEFLIASGFSF
jgi:outer membrane protein assembly factor BamA